jgi:hypothetical protein
MKVFTCYVPKKFMHSPKIKKLAKCVEIKFVKCKKIDTCKPYSNGEAIT